MSDMLPDEVVRGLDDARRAEAEAWWTSLDAAARAEFLALWDARSDDTAYYATRSADGRTEWHELPITLRATFVDPEDAREHEMWVGNLREYVNAHEEIRFFLAHRTFHICRAHADARRVLETGVVPAGFRCPLGRHDTCPFQRALALRPGCAILLGAARS